MTIIGAMSSVDPAAAWTGFVDELRTAGERMAELGESDDPQEQADGFRALLRALNNQLGRFEVDRARPELVPFNGWREKLLMDNPDFRYWVADIDASATYRIEGNVGDSVYMSITAYRPDGLAEAAATGRIDSDTLDIADDGGFEVVLSADDPGVVPWLPIPPGATAVWLRQFHDDVAVDRLGWCRIEPIEAPAPPPVIDPERFARHLQRAGSAISLFPRIVRAAVAADLAEPNNVRHWTEMAGGAAFTEPAIHYLRGAWELDDDEALVVDGPLVRCRYWNMLLYSRFLNSLDYRHRRVSRTAATTTLDDGRYRFVLAAHDVGVGDWLDTEGRGFGIFVMRFLQPVEDPELPSVERVSLDELRSRT